MAYTKQERYENTRNNIQSSDELSDTERRLILEFLDACDPNHHMVNLDSGADKAVSTLAQYSSVLFRVGRDLNEQGTPLHEATTYDVNSLMDGYLNGTVESTKDEGLSNGTVLNRQGPCRVFYRYHDDLNVVSEDIIMVTPNDPAIDVQDIFTTEEVHRMRNAAKETGIRDLCLLDMLLYTGQRKSAILNLRLKDIHVDEGTFRLNDTEPGLKGASGTRPLLGAEKSVRDWLRHHPTGNPDDKLITSKAVAAGRDDVVMGDRLSSAGVHRILNRIADIANVDKPVNPHAFRHYWVTVSIRDYDMDKDTVKHLAGHNPDSTVLETVYRHLSDDDYIDNAKEAYGVSEPEQESPLTPPVCVRCDEPLSGDWQSCPYCGYDYMGSEVTESDVKDSIFDSATQEDSEADSDDLQTFKRLVDEHPEELQKLLSNL